MTSTESFLGTKKERKHKELPWLANGIFHLALAINALKDMANYALLPNCPAACYSKIGIVP